MGGGGGRKAMPSSFITAITSSHHGVSPSNSALPLPAREVTNSAHNVHSPSPSTFSVDSHAGGGYGVQEARPSSLITAITLRGITVKFSPSTASEGSD